MKILACDEKYQSKFDSHEWEYTTANDLRIMLGNDFSSGCRSDRYVKCINCRTISVYYLNSNSYENSSYNKDSRLYDLTCNEIILKEIIE